MELPWYFLRQPVVDRDAATLSAFERLFAEIQANPNGEEIDYTLAAPKWQFLSYLCDHKGIVLHGSGNMHIAEFEPRQSNDVEEFGNRCAVYAASDGIWPIYFAIVDRKRYVTSLVNACFRVIEADQRSDPYYFFSINGDALPHAPWRRGMLYLLPGDGFEQQANQFYRGLDIEIAQWASLSPVRPLAKLAVGPEDFPFLAQIHPHDPAILQGMARDNPEGFPWIEELESPA